MMAAKMWFSLLLAVSLFCTSAVAAISFTPVPGGDLVQDTGLTRGACFVDYDGDGLEDLFFTREDLTDRLYKNNGDGTFSKIIGDPIVTDVASSDASTWVDYDQDGDLDCLISTWKGQPDLFLTNNGDGSISKDTTIGILSISRYSDYAGWTDFGRDGDLDVFLANSSGQNNGLYENDGAGNFTQVITGNVVADG
jgi:hypothetical protein